MNKNWYEKFGWKEDPLDWRVTSDFLIGLEQQQKDLQKLISQGKPIILFGHTGTGKTTLAQHLRLSNEYEGVYLRGDFLAGKQNLSLDKELTKRFIARIFSKKPTVLFLDEALATPTYFLQQIQAAYDTKRIQSIVFIQIAKDLSIYPETLRARIQAREGFIETTPLSPEKIYELMDKRLDGNASKLFEKNALMALIKSGGLVPRTVLDVCSEILDIEGGKKIDLKAVERFTKKKGERRAASIGFTSNVKSDVTSASSDLKDLTIKEAICFLLDSKPRTLPELVDILKKRDTSITKKLSVLMKEKKIVKIKDRPSTYDLEQGYRFNRITDKR